MSPVERFHADYVAPKRGRTLVVGSRIYGERPDRRALFADAIGVDAVHGPGVDVVADLEQGANIGMFDHVDCVSVLEHARRPWLLAATIERLLVAGGTLYLQVPFLWWLHAYPSDYWRFTVEAIRSIFPAIEWHGLKYAHQQLADGGKIPRMVTPAGHVYLARTEVCGFGEKA